MFVKYLLAIDCLRPTLRTNMPTGSLEKSTSIEKEYLVVGMYLATIETAERSPLIMLTARTLLHPFAQSVALSIKA